MVPSTLLRRDASVASQASRSRASIARTKGCDASDLHLGWLIGVAGLVIWSGPGLVRAPEWPHALLLRHLGRPRMAPALRGEGRLQDSTTSLVATLLPLLAWFQTSAHGRTGRRHRAGGVPHGPVVQPRWPMIVNPSGSVLATNNASSAVIPLRSIQIRDRGARWRALQPHHRPTSLHRNRDRSPATPSRWSTSGQGADQTKRDQTELLSHRDSGPRCEDASQRAAPAFLDAEEVRGFKSSSAHKRSCLTTVTLAWCSRKAPRGQLHPPPKATNAVMCKRLGVPVHPWIVRAEGEVVVPFPSGRVEGWARFDTFFQEEHERLFKALYFVTGNRHDAEELMQDAFLRLWERWDQIGTIEDPTGYLFRVALNGFRMRRRRAAMAVRKVIPVPERRDLFFDAEMRADVRQLLLEVTPRQRAALVLVDLLGYPAEQAARILRVRPSTVRALASQGRRALRATEGARDA